MNRRLVLTLATATVLTAALGSGALADTTSTTSARSHKVCVMVGSGNGLLAPGYCVGWDDPIGAPNL